MNSSNTSTIKSTTEVIELIFLTQVGLLTLFGNSLVISAFVFGASGIRTFTNYFVVNLAVSDLLVGCTSLPIWIIHRIDHSLISNSVFYAMVPLDILSGATSCLSLAAISIERAVAVKYPAVHMNLTRRTVLITLTTTWFLGIILSMSFYGAGIDERSFGLRFYTGIVFTFGYAVPLVVIVSSYVLIFHTAVNMMESHNARVATLREIRVAKTVSLVIGLFVVCWSPFFVVNMVWVYCGKDCGILPLWPIHFSKLMHFANSMMNFFVYGARSPDFRSFFLKVLCPTLYEKEKKKSNRLLVKHSDRITLSSSIES